MKQLKNKQVTVSAPGKEPVRATYADIMQEVLSVTNNPNGLTYLEQCRRMELMNKLDKVRVDHSIDLSDIDKGVLTIAIKDFKPPFVSEELIKFQKEVRDICGITND